MLDPDQVVASLNCVTPSQVRDVAQKVLVTERLNMAVVGTSRAQRRLAKPPKPYGKSSRPHPP